MENKLGLGKTFASTSKHALHSCTSLMYVPLTPGCRGNGFKSLSWHFILPKEQGRKQLQSHTFTPMRKVLLVPFDPTYLLLPSNQLELTLQSAPVMIFTV